jgi:hypothetical protein
MLCPPLTPLNRRPNVPNLPDPHRAPLPRSGFVLRAETSASGRFDSFATRFVYDTICAQPPKTGDEARIPGLPI